MFRRLGCDGRAVRRPVRGVSVNSVAERRTAAPSSCRVDHKQRWARLLLEGREERLGNRAVVGAARANRDGGAGIACLLAEGERDVLPSPGLSDARARPRSDAQAHLEPIDDELGAHVVGHRGVLDGRQLEPTLPAAQVGDVGHPQHIGGRQPLFSCRGPREGRAVRAGGRRLCPGRNGAHLAGHPARTRFPFVGFKQAAPGAHAPICDARSDVKARRAGPRSEARG